ncbi:Predicted chitinase [Chryseobacterium nakagawai]|uniref:DUF4280 domain-containing protein n=1 Tax=Chryseobacterium nakagawai TaxID=1241982 RepID=A0AAD0YUM3_CHRNA|nr:DUF4280 domain-containing protein [Chryseobacterium nakagawai]AZA93211.1 DUF4280 domain-containing protein [Chryseobacterium nakagawai]VEH19867.1 Predicted chitinase [Chryseobacterium nakagawai]
MSLKEKVVQGALCQCKFGSAPDKLKVLTQTKYYVNDNAGSSKLAATHKDIGATFEKNTFGSCSKKNNTPCSAVVTQWSGYYEKELYDPPGGYILLQDSKATCPIGGTDCISIIKSGQMGEPTKKNLQNSDSELQSHVNPLMDMKNLDKKDPYKFLNAE